MRNYFTFIIALGGNDYYNPHFLDQETQKLVDVKNCAQNHICSKCYVWIGNTRILLKKTNTPEGYMKFLKIKSGTHTKKCTL